MAHLKEKKILTEIILEEAQTLDLVDKYFKSITLNMLKGLV